MSWKWMVGGLAVALVAGCVPSEAELLRDKATARCVNVPDGVSAEELDTLMSALRTVREQGLSKFDAVDSVVGSCATDPIVTDRDACAVCVIAIVDAVYAE